MSCSSLLPVFATYEHFLTNLECALASVSLAEHMCTTSICSHSNLLYNKSIYIYMIFPTFRICIFTFRLLGFSCERFLHSFQASKLEKQSSMPESDYDNTFNDSEMDESG